ncbi:hypothetical protein B0J13DRAFT_554941 [Dactylonectria estremocensis]|uniref:Uncharacterized protein n=1 Tax=Dactylonectria estremocensis TaxID=1079267 RepID=A0A9P9J2X1_9HYPO|nr:hypothetical protein B0J13DRAFT_554941 [Dactylonectria estremocensis]
MSAAPPDAPENEAEADNINRVLQTPWNSKYSISQDGTTYNTPLALASVPVAKIDETGPYWESSWQSLDRFLEQETAEENLKNEFQERRNRFPDDPSVKARYKLHQDNVSKHRKIREVFGPGSEYHPNQLVSKHHLPPSGLCHKEIMYKLACKVSDLRVLHERGELAMDPWDFLRWRIARKAQALVGSTWESTRDVLKSVVTKICDDSGNEQSEKFEDRVLRKAVLRSARYQNRLASFGAKKVTKAAVGTRRPSGSRPRQAIANSRSRPTSSTVSVNRTSTSSTTAVRERQERRARLITRPSEYQGVNAFRRQQGPRRPSNTTSAE